MAAEPITPLPASLPARIPPQLGVLMTAVISFGFAHSAYFLLPKYLELELHADPAQIGTYMSAMWFTNVAVVPFAGLWIDRAGRRPFAYLGAAVLLAACLGFLAVDRLGPLLLALRIAHGVAFTFFFVATQTLAADLSPPEKLGQVLGYYGSGFVITNAAAPAAAEWLAGRAGWSAVFAATAALSLVPLVLLAFVREHRPLRHEHAAPAPGILETLLRPGFPRVLATSALAGVTFAAAFTFHQPFALSLGIERVSDFFVAYSITAMLVRGPLGAVADRAGRVRVTGVSLCIYAAAAFAMTQLASLGLVVTGMAFGAAHGLFYPALNAFALENASADVRAKVTALFNGAFNVGFSCGSLGLGFVAHGAGYTRLYALGGVCSLAALAVLPRTRASQAPGRE
ncbi:MAG TPA: MFS transporter [Myxococcota bacterium]|nr:MFS transporter [Myxococcota bacterium]